MLRFLVIGAANTDLIQRSDPKDRVSKDGHAQKASTDS